ncbi:MAG: tyrosine-type recombinase/integrase [Proteobacteria bacterium]|nr:tyrosine-type recombinase/integrase [Pseudomonadota bacterium]
MTGNAAAVDVTVFDSRKNEGRIANKRGTKKLYFDFFYHGSRIEKSTGLNDDPANRTKAEGMLEKILQMKQDGTLEFSKLFPGASEEEKEFHTQLEKGEYSPTPKVVTFGAYTKKWYETIWVNYPVATKQKDFKSVIDYWLVPFFGSKTFHHITGVTMQEFVATLKHKEGKKAGQPLARSTMVNILQIFKSVWDDAVIQHRWLIFDPLMGMKKHLPKKGKKKVEVFRFQEWETLLASMDEFYRPVTKLMVLTGLMASEIAALKASHIRDGYLYIEESIVRNVAKDELKNSYRERRIPVTQAIGEILDHATKAANGNHLFIMENGKTFSAELFQRRVWTKAMKASNIPYRKPYTTRHTFAAWALTLGIDPNRLVAHMGHASKQMIYEVYGKYTEGQEKDRQAIQEYFGNDFT